VSGTATLHATPLSGRNSALLKASTAAALRDAAALRPVESTGERQAAAPRFLRRDWLSRIPAWNGHEEERYTQATT